MLKLKVLGHLTKTIMLVDNKENTFNLKIIC